MQTICVQVKLEYLGEDREFPGSKKWSVEAIHVTTTRNKRRYTESELTAAARSLSFRHININHDPNQTLPFPENCTLFILWPLCWDRFLIMDLKSI